MLPFLRVRLRNYAILHLKYRQKVFLLISVLATLTLLLLSLTVDDETAFQGDWTRELSRKSAPLRLLSIPSTCKIPRYDPFDQSVRHLIKVPSKPMICTNLDASVTSSKGNTLYCDWKVLDTYVEYHASRKSRPDGFYSKDAFPDFLPFQKFPEYKVEVIALTTDKAKCCYSVVERLEHPPDAFDSSCDDKFRIDEACTQLRESETPISQECVLVQCTHNGSVVYKNIHYFIQEEKMISLAVTSEKGSGGDEVTPATRSDPGASDERLNVVIIGTDSVSRMDMIRSMPRTYRYLVKDLQSFDFTSYNKVGDNTLPNLLAALTGLTPGELANHSCFRGRNGTLDLCPFVWKDFRDAGYVTAFMEDVPLHGTFNFGYNGFVKPPVDFYPRAFWLASEQQIGHNKFGGYGNVCQGPESSVQVVNDYALNFLQTEAELRHFGLFWTSSFTHDQSFHGHYIDGLHLDLLKELNETGILNRTVLFFISDHGMRWGPMRETDIGFMEDRLPFLHIVLPKWFTTKYPNIEKTLKVNSERLATHFDLHRTLQWLGRKRNMTSPISDQEFKRRPLNLMQDIIPWNRSCYDAGIQEHYCACSELQETSASDHLVKQAALFLFSTVNDLLQPHSDCFQFTHATIEKARVSPWKNIQVNGQEKAQIETKSFLIQLKLMPKNVRLEGTAILTGSRGIFKLGGEISRINKYGEQSFCVTDDVIRKYCYCKKYKEKMSNFIAET